MSESPQNRRFYRIPYPWPERPALLLGETSLPVVDCSEGGLRFLTETAEHRVGSRIQGILRFREGQIVHLEGVVVWSREGQVALDLAPPGIPLRIILEEQRRLRNRYPTWPPA